MIEYSRKFVDWYCALMLEGKSQRVIHEEHPDQCPARSTTKRWIKEKPYFAKKVEETLAILEDRKKLAVKEKQESETKERPIKWSKALAIRICEQISMGNTLTAICREEDWTPCYTTLNKWRWQESSYQKEFNEMIEQARKAQVEYFYDRIIDIANTPVTNRNDEALHRKQLENLWRILAVTNPKKFSEKYLTKHPQKDKEPPKPKYDPSKVYQKPSLLKAVEEIAENQSEIMVKGHDGH